MVVCQLRFVCHQELSLEIAQSAISELFEEYRYNGQILGREFGLSLNNEAFECRLVCPEETALKPSNDSEEVTAVKAQLASLGIKGPDISIIGLETQSDFSDTCETPRGYILYSTFVQSCSPVRCSEHFMPIPLYKLPSELRYELIKWQESQAACDQIQMNALGAAEQQMVEQLSAIDSDLNQLGKRLVNAIEEATRKPAYLYLYRVGGDSHEEETQRTCPGCDNEWRLKQPLFELFDFKCDDCRLVSNISWDFQ